MMMKITRIVAIKVKESSLVNSWCLYVQQVPRERGPSIDFTCSLAQHCFCHVGR